MYYPKAYTLNVGGAWYYFPVRFKGVSFLKEALMPIESPAVVDAAAATALAVNTKVGMETVTAALANLINNNVAIQFAQSQQLVALTGTITENMANTSAVEAMSNVVASGVNTKTMQTVPPVYSENVNTAQRPVT